MPPIHDAERALLISYAPADLRQALTALLALDDALATLLRTTTQPAIAQIRLAWWRERLAELDVMPPAAMPVLQDLAVHVVGRSGMTGAMLVPIVEGWEVLIEAETLDRDALERFGAGRGGTLFDIVARLAEASAPAAAGEGWALADLARHLGGPLEATLARDMAKARLDQRRRWAASLRALGALAALARMDLNVPADQPVPVGSPRRVARMLWMRLTGR